MDHGHSTQSQRTVIAHSYSTVTAQSQHSHSTVTVQTQHTVTAHSHIHSTQSQHHHSHELLSQRDVDHAAWHCGVGVGEKRVRTAGQIDVEGIVPPPSRWHRGRPSSPKGEKWRQNRGTSARKSYKAGAGDDKNATPPPMSVHAEPAHSSRNRWKISSFSSRRSKVTCTEVAKVRAVRARDLHCLVGNQPLHFCVKRRSSAAVVDPTAMGRQGGAGG